MQQYDRLWQFQEVDTELDSYEREMKNSSNRKELIKYRDFLLEQQNALKKIETDSEVTEDRIDALVDEVERLRKGIAEAQAAFEANPPQNQQEAQQHISGLQKLITTLNRYENEIQRMRKDADMRDRQQREVRVRAAKARAEFDRIKVIYDEEYKTAKSRLEELKKKVAEQAAGIPADLIERYNQIKKHTSRPLTHLRGNRCGGCNTQLPSAQLDQARGDVPYVECENCGRMIFVNSPT